MKNTVGQSIGNVLDKSAPTEIPCILLKAIITPYISCNPQWAISRR